MSDGKVNERKRRRGGGGEKGGDLNKETYIDTFPGKLGTAMLGKEGVRKERGGRGGRGERNTGKYSKGGKRRRRF